MKAVVTSLLFASLALAQGTVKQAAQQIGTSSTYVISMDWTADASGALGVTAAVLPAGGLAQGYRVFVVETAPGTPAPTNGYSIKINDSTGYDLLVGQASAASSTTAQAFTAYTPIPLFGTLYLQITGIATANAQGKVLIYLAPFGDSVITAPTTTINTNVDSIPLISCYLTNACVIYPLGGRLIWTNPTTIPAGIVPGLKINVSNNIGATPSVGHNIGLQVRVTNDPPAAGTPTGLQSASMWGADLIVQQSIPIYEGPATIVVAGGIGTVTTTSPHLLQGNGTTYKPNFVTFTGTADATLNGTVWTVSNVVSSTVFTFASLASAPGSYSGTMYTAATIRTLEAEIQSACTATNIQLDAFNGTRCRANGVEIISLSGSNRLTSALTTNVNSTDPNLYWHNGIELARIRDVGLTFRELDTFGNSFQVASIWDQAYSPIVLKVSGIHDTIFDIGGVTGPITNIFNLSGASPTNFVLGAGSNAINFQGVKMTIVGPAASGTGNEPFAVNANGIVFGMRHSATGSAMEVGVLSSDALSLMTGTALFIPSLATTPGSKQPLCRDTSTGQIYSGSGGGC